MAETSPPPQPNQPKPKIFRYLDLPAKLQLRILGFAVLVPDVIDISNSECGGRSQPAITRVSAGIRADALPFYYSLNRFKASYCNDNYETTLAWLNGMGAASRSKIGELVLYGRGNEIEEGDDCCMESARGWLSRLGAEVVKNAGGRYDVSFPAV